MQNGEPLGLFARWLLAWSVFFRILGSARFGGQVQALTAPSREPEDDASVSRDSEAPPGGRGRAPQAVSPDPHGAPEPDAAGEAPSAAHKVMFGPEDGAVLLLALLQEEGRLVDFLKESVDSHPDADVGALAKVIHAGCNRALAHRITIEPVFADAEGSTIDVSETSRDHVKWTGNVGKAGASSEGTLRHRGWLAKDVRLPERLDTKSARVIARAEVEA